MCAKVYITDTLDALEPIAHAQNIRADLILLANAPMEVAVGVNGQASAQLGTPFMELA